MSHVDSLADTGHRGQIVLEAQNVVVGPVSPSLA